ncbi:putative NAD(P)H quinone oxidoreductase, PIG3 family [Micromonospora pattaloongensis]|uniref:Putative NAD(P)H quinone oxidoreductase, PIG3 family n=1 Tax=Micromonospora pattaloongensis TaxID=405436 RepID=A0A1H3HKK3_9ACTN|nr:NAD(P)H-quinone oxidoreductase [Micromonospora pattaloongensis]SDY16073.1 putative NAD(P)H quinone oxidoreductase, PIG3 family [Micromonospora pattaloongensis]
MHAITIPQPGGPDALVWAEVPDPEPGPGEVVVDVTASAVNRADLLQRQGLYPPPAGAPPYPGLECSGVITAVGPDVPDHRVGDRVCALLAGGGYAERVVVPAGQLLPIPTGVSLADAAALPEVACTVWSNVVRLAGLRSGETLLVHGGGSGIGTFAIQLGAALGATVITTARAGKHDRLRELGAHHTIDYTDADFVAETKRIAGGADVILDIIGGPYLDRNVDALAIGGRLSIIGLQGGRKAELNLGALLAKRASVHATTLRARPVPEKAEIVRGVHQEVWPLISAGTVRPIVDRRLPLAEAAQAHRIVESSDHLGKVLLTVEREPGRNA